MSTSSSSWNASSSGATPSAAGQDHSRVGGRVSAGCGLRGHSTTAGRCAQCFSVSNEAALKTLCKYKHDELTPSRSPEKPKTWQRGRRKPSTGPSYTLHKVATVQRASKPATPTSKSSKNHQMHAIFKEDLSKVRPDGSQGRHLPLKEFYMPQLPEGRTHCKSLPPEEESHTYLTTH